MIDKLEMFIALARAQHFGKAAELCGVTQPTLSAAIRQLEAQLGAMLVQRGSRYVGLTPEGERVLVWARKLTGDAQAMRTEISSFSRSLRGQLRLGVVPTALSVVAELTSTFAEQHPEVTFTILSRSSEEIVSMTRDFALEGGVTYLDEEATRDLSAIPLYEERYRLVASKRMALPDVDTLRWSDLRDLPLCLLTPDMQNRRIVDYHLSEAGIGVAPSVESDSVISLFSHVRTGRWAGIMPAELISAFGAEGDLRVIPIAQETDAPQHQIGLLTAKRDPQSPLTSALLEIARKVAALRKD